MEELITARELLIEIRAVLRIPPHSVSFNGDVHHAYRDQVIEGLMTRINAFMEVKDPDVP